MSGLDLPAVDEPLDLELGVIDRLQTTLEMSVLTLLKVLQTGTNDTTSPPTQLTTQRSVHHPSDVACDATHPGRQAMAGGILKGTENRAQEI